ncbi:MAG: orange carotenoid protein N-terminal domain-containing protein [Elainellaceae cyanobacterium]
MTYLTDDAVKQPLEAFRGFEVDTQLALLWYAYEEIKGSLTPSPTNDVEGVASAVFDRIKAMSKENQLQAQRDIASKANTEISREYGVLSPPAKLEVWLLLAQGIENGTIIDVPSDYQAPSEANEFLNQFKNLDFEQQINFIRNAVTSLGLDVSQTPV